MSLASEAIRHREFAFAAGEMSKTAFTQFLATTLGNAASVSRDGAIAFICMDWRYMGELSRSRLRSVHELKNPLRLEQDERRQWATFYRSKHELIFVFGRTSMVSPGIHPTRWRASLSEPAQDAKPLASGRHRSLEALAAT